MNRTEKTLWDRLRGVLPGVLDRVENGASPGFPDVYGDYQGCSYWVELKVSIETIAKEARRSFNLLRSSQVIWCRRHLREGARGFLIVGYKKGLVVYRLNYKDREVALQRLFVISGPFTAFNELYFITEMRKALDR